MNIAIIGGHGFIGRHIAAAVAQQNDLPVVFARGENADMRVDLRDAETTHQWQAKLTAKRIDAVINCVGILQGSVADMDAVHHCAPAAIASACRALKVSYLHIGVLGFYDSPAAPYFISKRRGEEAIRIANPAATIVRPSLVFGLDSAATKITLAHAKSPLCVLPRKTKSIAPIHVDDLAALCAYLVGTIRAQGRDIDAVGSREMSIADYIARLRIAMQQPPALQMRLPNALFRVAARIAATCGSKTFCPEVIDLMEHAHVGTPGALAHWLHRPPIAVAQFLDEACVPVIHSPLIKPVVRPTH